MAAKHELKIQQSHTPERWSCSLRVRGHHFASKVSYNAGAATDDYAGAAQISAARALPLSLIFSGFLTPYFRGPRPFFPRCSPLPVLSSLFSDFLCPSANLGAGASASAPRHVRLCSQIRLRLLPRQGRRITLWYQFGKERTVPSCSLSFCLHAALSFILFYPC